MMLVVLAALAVSVLVFARRTPVQYKVWVMDPLRCGDLPVPDTTFLRICLDSSSFRGRAGPLLHEWLSEGLDSADVALLAESAMVRTHRRATNTKAPEDYREAVTLGQFADSIRTRLSRDVAHPPSPAGGGAVLKR
ncbi:MAG: hypothetical protein JF589_13085 [Gemmatimonadetes bacterium]|nr:hypothetical protein [Gemmatimonadota bacterium]